MGVVFFCQSCGARFEVEPRMAGKRGRCRKCGHSTMIPRAEELPSLSAISVSAAAGPAVRAVPAASTMATASGAPSLTAWLKAGISQVGLVPLTADPTPPRPVLPSALDDSDDGDSKPYALARPIVDDRGPVRIQDHVLIRLWRREIGGIEHVFRWLNESAYVVSIPFLMILLFGTALKSRPLALFGATFVVLLNLGRLAAGAANLALVPLRDGLNPRKIQGPARRVAEPILTIVLVVLGFTFIPWLADRRPDRANAVDRLRDGAANLEKDIRGEVHTVVNKAEQIGTEKLGPQVQRRLEDLKGERTESHPRRSTIGRDAE